eukprot:c28867_g1_i1 orf=314-3514(+)
MMQMLGLRGSAQSKPKGEDVQSSSSKAPGPAKALRLVYCDERGKFRMDADAVAALQLAKGPLGVISVCGRARQGKSFILNQLLGQSSGFQVGPTHRPCTKGLWMWSVPLKRLAPDGTDYSLLLLDTEGIDSYDQTGTYSTQIFSLAVLLSSMFVYNQMGGIDEAALDRLSLVTEMTKHIRVRASQNRASFAELGQFSPVFLWLLRDFYLDLTEDGRRIMPKEYLEAALRPVPGSGKAIAGKNEIRDSIRALFPDRHCFTLVRPLNEEHDLQRLDHIPLEKMRPEFRSGLDTLTRFIFERSTIKQMGSTFMTGPLLAGLTQSFLDAINAGAVPTITTSWQNVEESECRRAHDMALVAYTRAFDKSPPADEVVLQEVHEAALQDAMRIYNSEAVGAGSARHKYEKLLTVALKRQFEEYKRKVYMEAEVKCSKAVESIDEKLRAACHSPAATLDQVLQVLNELVAEYEKSTLGPAKWKKLVKFLQQSLEGPLADLTKRWGDQRAADNAAFQLKCRSLEDRLSLLGKQLDAAQRDAQDWKRRYETMIVDYKSSSEESTARYSALQNKYSTLEERCATLSHQLEVARKDSLDWRNKHANLISERQIEEERITSEITALQSRCRAAEARLAAAREQTEAAKEEATEWRRKHDATLKESHAALEKATSMREHANKQAQAQEDGLRMEFSSIIAEKEKELKDMQTKVEYSEHYISQLDMRVKDQELKLSAQEDELITSRSELRHLQDSINVTKAACQSAEQELEARRQDKFHDEERLKIDMKRREEAEQKCRIAEKEAKRASEVAEKAREDASLALREKLETQRLAVERLAAMERAEGHIAALLREKGALLDEVKRIQLSESTADSRATALERRLEEREKEIADLLQSAHEQRANTIQVLEGLLATERQACTEANGRADSLSLQLQMTQGKLDALQEELTAVRLNEAALDSKLKSRNVELAASVGKRQKTDDYGHGGMAEDMQMDMDNGSQRRARVMSTENGKNPAHGLGEGDSSVKHDNKGSVDIKDSQEYLKFTVSKLKQELTNAGFGAELLQLRTPTKKELVDLYERLVMK